MALIPFYCFFICVFPLDYAIAFVLLYYSLEQGLAKWAFFLAFQQVAYYALSFLLDKEQLPPKKGILSLAYLQIYQLFIGLLLYESFYLEEPTKLGGILIFCFAHLVLFMGFILFQQSLPQPLIPFFFSALFYFLPYCPGWLERWIEGIDLLLFLLCLFLFIREEGKMRWGGCRPKGKREVP